MIVFTFSNFNMSHFHHVTISSNAIPICHGMEVVLPHNRVNTKYNHTNEHSLINNNNLSSFKVVFNLIVPYIKVFTSRYLQLYWRFLNCGQDVWILRWCDPWPILLHHWNEVNWQVSLMKLDRFQTSNPTTALRFQPYNTSICLQLTEQYIPVILHWQEGTWRSPTSGVRAWASWPTCQIVY